MTKITLRGISIKGFLMGMVKNVKMRKNLLEHLDAAK